MLINISNHPSSQWSEEQLEAASRWGEICDMPFPDISPRWDGVEVACLARSFLLRVKQSLSKITAPSAVHVAGEPVFTFQLVNLLLREGYCVVTSTTERCTFMEGDCKISRFHFVRFRSYELPAPL